MKEFKYIRCDHCGGSGRAGNTKELLREPCPKCLGGGQVRIVKNNVK